MSIATSVIVRVSPCMRMLCATMSCGAVLIGVLIAYERIGELPWTMRALLAAASIFLGVFGFYHGGRHRNHQHIGISGTGQIRLAEMGDKGSCDAANRPYVKKNGQVVHLLPSSTVWPRMLLLRLRTGTGKIVTLSIMPDSVSQDSFRALSVACRWILSRTDSTDKR